MRRNAINFYTATQSYEILLKNLYLSDYKTFLHLPWNHTTYYYDN
jgi:hypothetical protein